MRKKKTMMIFSPRNLETSPTSNPPPPFPGPPIWGRFPRNLYPYVCNPVGTYIYMHVISASTSTSTSTFLSFVLSFSLSFFRSFFPLCLLLCQSNQPPLPSPPPFMCLTTLHPFLLLPYSLSIFPTERRKL